MTQWNFSFMVVVFAAHVVINLRHNFFLKTCWRESKRNIQCSQLHMQPMGNCNRPDSYCKFVSHQKWWEKRHSCLLSSEYLKVLAYKLAHCPSTSHERTEDAGCTNCSLLVQLTSCPTMSLVKAKQSRSQRSVSDKTTGLRKAGAG